MDMTSFIKKRSKKAGMAPGTLIHIGEKKVEKQRITIIDYDESQYIEREVENIEECFPFKEKPTVTWINIDGVHKTDTIQKLGDHFGVHPLILEDILNTDQRPKIDDQGNYIFIVIRMFRYNQETEEVVQEQLSIVLGPDFVLSFQESEGDVFNPLRDRIRKKARVRKMGADYLAYALIDAVVDGYFMVLEKTGEKIETLEDELIADPSHITLQQIHELKRHILVFRKSVWPMREVISTLEKGDVSLLQESTLIYFRDIYDHTVQAVDTIESFRDMLSGMLDIYLSSVSNRMNNVMKVLTVIATIFIPLTFIVGVYGMNFKYMPELEWHWGYPAVMLAMFAMALSMAVYFLRKKWL